jgi:hypothetical protein
VRCWDFRRPHRHSSLPGTSTPFSAPVPAASSTSTPTPTPSGAVQRCQQGHEAEQHSLRRPKRAENNSDGRRVLRVVLEHSRVRALVVSDRPFGQGQRVSLGHTHVLLLDARRGSNRCCRARRCPWMDDGVTTPATCSANDALGPPIGGPAVVAKLGVHASR